MTFKRNPPHYVVGSHIGELEVIEVLEYESRGLAIPRWWYKMQCSCGNIEELNQSHLLKRTDCKQCLGDRKGWAISEAKRKSQSTQSDSPVPDFARMRLSGPRGRSGY